MKGFLKKDLALLYNTGKVYLAVIAMGIVLGLVNKEMRSFSSSFIMIMLALVLGVMGFCMVIMLISYTFSVKALEKKEF